MPAQTGVETPKAVLFLNDSRCRGGHAQRQLECGVRPSHGAAPPERGRRPGVRWGRRVVRTKLSGARVCAVRTVQERAVLRPGAARSRAQSLLARSLGRFDLRKRCAPSSSLNDSRCRGGHAQRQLECGVRPSHGAAPPERGRRRCVWGSSRHACAVAMREEEGGAGSQMAWVQMQTGPDQRVRGRVAADRAARSSSMPISLPRT